MHGEYLPGMVPGAMDMKTGMKIQMLNLFANTLARKMEHSGLVLTIITIFSILFMSIKLKNGMKLDFLENSFE